jgi:hypothetical protein
MAARRRSSIPIFILLVVTVFAVGRYVRSFFTGELPAHVMPLPSPSPSLSSAAAAPTAQTALTAPVPHTAGSSHRIDSTQELKRFQARFGSNLTPAYGRSGKISRLKGAPGEGTRAETTFSPREQAKVIARAKQVVKEAHELLGIESGFPLDGGIARTGEVSAQVTFRQSYQGEPVEPGAEVVIDLGSQGEVIEVSSSYVHGLDVVNSAKITAGTAQATAEAAIIDPSSAVATTGGEAVVFVAHDSEGNAHGRHAYRFNVRGREVYVDSESGTVLSQRDRRQY